MTASHASGQCDPAAPGITNALSIDVEDYFQVSAFADRITPADWPSYPQRLEANMDNVLAILDEHKTKATFFTLGWVAERYPAVIRNLVAAGHELASHGFSHVRVTDQTVDDFRQDVRRTKSLLEDTGGVAVRGYRAASFSITKAVPWVFDVLAEEGHRYSSSVYPIRHDHYGIPDAPRFAYRPAPTIDLMEIPITTIRALGQNFPSGGGGYFRLFPYGLTHWALRRVNHVDRRSCVFYFHPWEIDPGQPRLADLSLKTRFRHYTNLGRMERRLRRLLSDFRWNRVDAVFLDG
jgi:polysaccharide deacetylase family protein (PEP-CTERM system associated)